MNSNRKRGDKGEDIAVDFLIQQGFRILERNWRSGRLELDVICMDGDVMVFVEVKTRNDNSPDEPERYVTKRKERFLTEAADAYIYRSGHEGEGRFDIIAVTLRQNGGTLVTHFRDAFYEIE